MIRTIYPPTWTAQEREVYERWNAGQDLSEREIIVLKGCHERVRKGSKPETIIIDDPHIPDEQRSSDSYGIEDRHMT